MHFDGTIWRPPYEAASLLIQVTAGCTHHSCKFCTLYEDLPFKFRMSPPSEVEEDLAAVSRYCQDAPWFRVFFTGANPFVLTTDKLKTLAQMVKKYCPNYSSIGCFGRITDVTNKTVDELKELRALGYNGLTFGVETGDDKALAFMNKGFRASDVLEQCRKLEAAGISYNFFYLTGISGAGRGEIGAKASAELFNQLHPQIIESSRLTNSMSCLHNCGSPNGASEPNRHFSGTSVRAVLTDSGVKAADKSKYVCPCSFAKAITSIQFEPPMCPKITGTAGYFRHRPMRIFMPFSVTGLKVCTQIGRL